MMLLSGCATNSTPPQTKHPKPSADRPQQIEAVHYISDHREYIFETEQEFDYVHSEFKKMENNEEAGEEDTLRETETIITEKEQKKHITIKRMTFPEVEYAKIPTSGTSKIEGTIHYRDNDENIKPASSVRLYLNPITSYSKEWHREVILNGNKVSKADPRLYKYLKYTTTSRSGKFAFYGIPQGEYYLTGKTKEKGTEFKIFSILSTSNGNNSKLVLQQ